METTTKNEEQFIEDIKLSIEETSNKVANRVIASAYAYLERKDCFDLSKEAEIKAFFLKKIPGVMSTEISKELHTVLGLNLDIN